MAVSPSPFTAPSPKRISPLCTEKVRSERFTSGGNTWIPIDRTLAMWRTSFSVSLISEDSKAAMNSTG